MDFKAGIPHTFQNAVANCPAPSLPTGGGLFVLGNGAEKFVLSVSQPGGDHRGGPGVPGSGPQGWLIGGFYEDTNPKDPPLKLDIFVGCLRTV